jgi:hypothetical protein
LKRSHSYIKGPDLYLVDAVYEQIKEGSTVTREKKEKSEGYLNDLKEVKYNKTRPHLYKC